MTYSNANSHPSPAHGDTNMSTQQPSFLNTCIGIIVDPVPTLRSVVHQSPIGWAFIVIIAVSVAEGILQAATIDPSDFPEAEWLTGPIQALFIIAVPVMNIVICALGTGAYWIMSRILGGNGSYGGLFAGIAFTYVPLSLAVLVSFIALQINPLGSFISGMFLFGVAIWTTVLAVIVVRESNNFSIARAVTAVLIPLAAFLVLVIMFAFVAVLIAIAVTEGNGWQ